MLPPPPVLLPLPIPLLPLHAARSGMAALLGQPSYAHLKAADATLAGTPEAATAFLQQLAQVPGAAGGGSSSDACCRGLRMRCSLSR